MLFTLSVIADADEQQTVGIFSNLVGVLLTMYLVDGAICILVDFQFNNDGWCIYILTGDEYQVGKSLSCGQFALYDVVASGIVVGNGKYAGQ